jgi:acetyltransferase-like isoleucine patch superfamily enzyme
MHLFFYTVTIEIVLYLTWLLNFIINLLPTFFKKIILKIFLKKFSFKTIIDQNLYFRNPINIYINQNVNINYGCMFFSSFKDKEKGKIILEENVTLSPNVRIYSIAHDPNTKNFKSIAKSVTIKKNSWICANSVILPGVVIGKNSVIAANSLVNKSIGDNEIWGGVPAKFIKKRKNIK